MCYRKAGNVGLSVGQYAPAVANYYALGIGMVDLDSDEKLTFYFGRGAGTTSVTFRILGYYV